MIKKYAPYYIIVFSIFLGISGPDTFSDGMFMDGLIYSVVSKNLANGSGSFWYLHFTDTYLTAFHEHPPLAFGIQSLCYKIFGSSIYIERFYSFFMFVITGIIIVLIWNKITVNKRKSIGWLPLFLWVTIPLTTWSCANNLLENTMMVFVSLSVFFVLNSLEKNRNFNILLAGFMLFLAFLTKGFVAVFPLTSFFWIWLFANTISFKRFVYNTIALVFFTSIPFILIYLFNKHGTESLFIYINKQVLGSIKNVRNVDTRFFILLRSLEEMIVPFFIVILTIFIAWRKKYDFKHFAEPFSKALIFFGIALSGVIPIMISMKQSGFYLVPAFPFFCIGLALIISPFIHDLVKKWMLNRRVNKIIRFVSLILLLVSIIVSIPGVNKTGRDLEKLDDIYKLLEIIPENTTIDVSRSLISDWALHGYLARHANISLNYSENRNCDYYLSQSVDNLGKHVEIHLDLKVFKIYRKVNIEDVN